MSEPRATISQEVERQFFGDLWPAERVACPYAFMAQIAPRQIAEIARLADAAWDLLQDSQPALLLTMPVLLCLYEKIAIACGPRSGAADEVICAYHALRMGLPRSAGRKVGEILRRFSALAHGHP